VPRKVKREIWGLKSVIDPLADAGRRAAYREPIRGEEATVCDRPSHMARHHR